MTTDKPMIPLSAADLIELHLALNALSQDDKRIEEAQRQLAFRLRREGKLPDAPLTSFLPK